MWQEEEMQGLILVWSLPASLGHSLCLHLSLYPAAASSRPKWGPLFPPCAPVIAQGHKKIPVLDVMVTPTALVVE